MDTRQLGNSPVHVTPIIFGAWAVGGWMWGGNDEQDSLDAIRASIDHGVTTIDTAAIYGMGYSEELVGKAIAGRRNKVVIATKCGMRWDAKEGSEPWPQKDRQGRDIVIYKNAKPASIALECERSLKRLDIDEIDLYQIHWPDTSTPVADSINAMLKLQKQGKIRAIGVSNYDVKWLAGAKKVGARIASLQPPYSLIQRNIETDILPFCRENNIGVIVYSPLERGLLTGKVEADRKFPPGDHRAGQKYFTPENRERVLAALDKIRPIAEKHRASLTQVVINWTVHEPGITAALVGARNAGQAEHNAKSLAFSLTAEERGQIRKAFDQPAKVMNE